MEMKLNLFVFVTYITHICWGQDQSTCTTPSGEIGRCVSIYDCMPVVELLGSPNITNREITSLKKSQCGTLGDTPKVCCPKVPSDGQCFTPDEQLSSCVGIYSCPKLLNLLLQQPIQKNTSDYVKNHRCEGPEQYSICCPPDVDPGPLSRNVEECALSASPPDSKTKCCGVESSADRIFGGNVTSIDQYPWLALIEYQKKGETKLLCGGTLISGKYVLTAAHCVIGAVLKYGVPTSVRLSEYDISNEGFDCTIVNGGGEDCTEGIVVIPIERRIPHPHYDANNKRNDIALLRLKELATFTDFIRPICLPSKDVAEEQMTSINVFAAGWGATESTKSSNVKLHVSLPLRTLVSCQEVYSKHNVTLLEGQLCAGGIEGHDSCKGDSGGPLMYFNADNKWELMGVVSFGPTPCGREGFPGVYTKVTHYMPWIRSNIKP